MRDLLTVCVIARNEEAYLPSCLSSVETLGAALVVVDCGSTDKTSQIAASHGAKVVSTPWQNDFAAARNRALAEVSTPWVLMLDADERISSTAPALVAQIVASCQELDGIALPVLFYDGPTLIELVRQARLFRREGASFAGKIMETLRLASSRWSFFPDPQLLEIHNYGHFGQARIERGSTAISLSLLEEDLGKTEEPGIRRQLIERMAGEWLRSASYAQAANCFNSLVQETNPEVKPHLTTYLGLIEALLGMEDFANALEATDSLLALDSDLKVAWSRKAYALNRLGRLPEAKLAALAGIAARNCLSWTGAENARITHTLWYDLGNTLTALDERSAAIYAFMKLKVEVPNWQSPIPLERLVFRLLVAEGALDEAKLLFREIETHVPESRSFLLEDLSQLGQPELALDLLLDQTGAPITGNEVN